MPRKSPFTSQTRALRQGWRTGAKQWHGVAGLVDAGAFEPGRRAPLVGYPRMLMEASIRLSGAGMSRERAAAPAFCLPIWSSSIAQVSR